MATSASNSDPPDSRSASPPQEATPFFTKSEIATLVLVFLVLGVMALGSMQIVRDGTPGAAKASCSNSLRQTMLAMHNFQSSFKKLPGEKAKLVGRFSMWAEILPQLDQGALYDRLNFRCPAPTVLDVKTEGDVLREPREWLLGDMLENKPSGGRFGPHVEVMQTVMPSLRCWADHAARTAPGSVNFHPVVTARRATDVEGRTLSAVWEADDETTFPLEAVPPAFASRVQMISLDNITDGGQYTVGIVERIKGRLPSGKRDRRNQAVAGGVDASFVVDAKGRIVRDNTRMVAACNAGSAAAVPDHDLSGSLWLQHTCRWMGCANLMGPPNSVPCRGAAPGADLASRGIAPPSSYHPGGANAAFFDGHVEFLSDQFDLQVLHAYSTPNGGERIPEE